MARRHREIHRRERTGWLRAAVLGSNDAIVSTAGLMMGVAATDASREARMAREQQITWIKRLLFVSTIVVFPAIGYVVGVTIGG